MGVKLYPPVVENTLPACYRDEKGMVTITIPFSMNRSVSAAQVGGFQLKIKTIQTGSYLYTFNMTNPMSYTINDQESYVTFQVQDTDNKLKPGQFYKAQLAYISVSEAAKQQALYAFSLGDITLEEYEKIILEDKDSIIGFFSTAGTFKYTIKPNLFINNFSSDKLNSYTHSFTGYYDQTEGDISERVYSYRFDIYNAKNNLVYTSGDCVHNSLNDDTQTFGLSYDTFKLFADLEYNAIYTVQYTITTINNLTLSTPKYRMSQRETVDPEIHAEIQASLNFEDGYILVELIQNTPKTILDSGSFVISRADEDSNFINWEEIYKFKLWEESPEKIKFRDYSFKQGKHYKYSLQQYNDYDLYSKRIISNTIYGDFEDGFLFDGERQLKIRYNMKMSKLTKTILEAKQETIGSQYPFFFRNGTVNYHEFPINGLISYSMDDNRLFMDKESLNLVDDLYRTHTSHDAASTYLKDSVGEEIARERIFKTEVFQWLNDGKPKLLRTPTEGNFIVRLMKISLSPEEKLGRMLHNFSCTAYEIAECTSENLRAYNLLRYEDRDIYVPMWKTIDLSGTSPTEVLTLNIPQDGDITSLRFDDMRPGEYVRIMFKDRSIELFQIGATGSYHLDNIKMPIRTISFVPKYVLDESPSLDAYGYFTNTYYCLDDKGSYQPATNYSTNVQYYLMLNNPLQGLITYSYTIKRDNSYAYVQQVSYNDANIKQFIGDHDILEELTTINGQPNVKSELSNICYLKATKRPVDRITSKFADADGGDNGEFFYGADNEIGEARSESTPKVELMYPIGMRLYEPVTYYIKTNDNRYVQEVDPMGEWQDRAYYLKGRYRIPTGPDGTGKTVKIPIGLIAYTEIKEQIYVEDAEGNKIPDPYKKWRANIKYYRQTKTLKGQIRYHEILNITKDESYVFNDKTFYRIAYIENIDGEEKTFYTWARRFDETLSKNYEYYVLDDSFEEYVDAYVAPSKEYIYEPYQFYMHVYNDSPDPSVRKDEYQLCQELEFNFHRIEDDSVEYENDIIKYYKVKTILPHILHEVGTEWEEITDNARPGYAGSRYKFHPIKYKDFYNNQDFSLEDYCPCIYINGQEISVKDFVTFGPVDLTKFGPITELRCGNGVIVEVIYQTKEYNYILEYETGLYSNMQEALTKWETAMNNLHLDPSDSKYVDLSDMSELLYSQYYNNSFQKRVQSEYVSANSTIVEAMRKGGKL